MNLPRHHLSVIGDFLMLLALAGLFTGRPVVVAASAFVAGLWLFSWGFGRRALARITVQQQVRPWAVPIGEPVDLAVSVSNHFGWPIPVLEWSDQLPDLVEASAARTGVVNTSEGRRPTVYGRFSMGRREIVTQHVVVRAQRRGRYVFGPLYLALRDPLGVAELDRVDAAPTALTVFPQLFPLPGPLVLPMAPRGARRGPPWNPPDPTRYIGVRPYEPGDSPRLIHPFASARTGTLQVKRLETEADDQVELVALAATAPFLWQGIQSERLESLVSAVASAAHHHLTRSAAVGLSLAGSVYGSPKGVDLPPRAGRDQWMRIQTALAWVMPGGGEAGELGNALTRLAQRARPGTQVFVFTCFYLDAWTPIVRRLSRRGMRVVWVAVAPREPWPTLPGVRMVTWTPEVVMP
jgi:uncharacterized protein (DUF58 family)